MASRTQLRLGQVTGSFGDAEGKIVDNLAVAATLGAIPAGSGSMVSALSQFASAIKRINGGTAFTAPAAGVLDNTSTKIGSAAGSGKDLFMYTAGTAAHVGIQWDADGETEGILIGGANDHGVDLKFYGETAGRFMHWDMSGDELVLAAATKLSFHDAAGGENIVASSDGHLEVNAGTTLDMTAPTVDINASTAVTIDSDTVTFGSANSTDPLVTISNTTNDANGARLRFVKDKGAAGAANDVAGLIEFFADDANQDQVKFSDIKSQVKVATNGQEGGKLTISVAEHDGTSTAGLVIEDGDADGELDVTIAAGAASLTTVSGNLTVTGDLTVSGDTVQVDVSKLTVEDPIIELARGNTGGDTLDIGFFGRYNNGSNNVSAGLFRDTNDEKFHFFKETQEDLTGATVVNTGATGYAKASLVVDALDADGGVTIDNITIDGTEIDLSSGDLTLDVAGNIKFNADGNEFFFEDGGTQRGIITSMNPGSGEMLILSSSTSHHLALMSRAGNIMLSNGTGASSIIVDTATHAAADAVVIRDNSDIERIYFYSPGGGGDELILSGAIKINGNDDSGAPAALEFLEAKANGTNSVTLDVPAAIGSSYTLTLPAANGSSGQYLRLSDGSGNLTFSNAESNTASKTQLGVIAALTAGTALNPNSATVSNTAPYTRSALNLSAVPHDVAGNLVNVFVNGQLLVSGTEANINAGTADYNFVDISATSTIKFGFDLEIDDVVIVDVK